MSPKLLIHYNGISCLNAAVLQFWIFNLSSGFKALYYNPEARIKNNDDDFWHLGLCFQGQGPFMVVTFVNHILGHIIIGKACQILAKGSLGKGI